MPEEGLADAHEFLQSEWDSLSRRGVLVSDDELFKHFVRKFGDPVDVAASYAPAAGAVPRLVDDGSALHDASASERAESPWYKASKPIAVAVLVLLAGVTAACGALVLTHRASAPSGRTFITHQGVSVYLPDGEVSFADRVVSFQRGAPNRGLSTDPQAAIGPPDCKNEQEQEATFVALGHGGTLILEFSDNWLCDGDGPDLAIFEVGPQLEFVEVAVSEDGSEWYNLGRTRGRDVNLDLATLQMSNCRFRFVRVVDAKGGKSYRSNWPGADIDAIGAIHSAPRPAIDAGS